MPLITVASVSAINHTTTAASIVLFRLINSGNFSQSFITSQKILGRFNKVGIIPTVRNRQINWITSLDWDAKLYLCDKVK